MFASNSKRYLHLPIQVLRCLHCYMAKATLEYRRLPPVLAVVIFCLPPIQGITLYRKALIRLISGKALCYVNLIIVASLFPLHS
jgi:hypothetical protein